MVGFLVVATTLDQRRGEEICVCCEGGGRVSGAGQGGAMASGRRHDGVRNTGCWLLAFVALLFVPRLGWGAAKCETTTSIDGPSRCGVTLRATGVRKRCALVPPYGRLLETHDAHTARRTTDVRGVTRRRKQKKEPQRAFVDSPVQRW